MRAYLDAARRAHLGLMVDVCVISRRSTVPAYDRVTAGYVDRPTTAVYSGRCRVKPVGRTRDDTTGVRETRTARYDVALPQDTAVQVEVGDLLTVTESRDSWLVGRALTVSAVGFGSTSSARWLTVDDVRG